MNATYDLLMIAIPLVIALFFGVITLYLGKNAVEQLRGVIGALVALFRPYADDTNDALIKLIAKNFGITEDQAVELIKSLLDVIEKPSQEIKIKDKEE